MFPSPDAFACFPLPSSGYRGRSLQKPCGSPPSPVLWGRKTARRLSVIPPVDPRDHVPPYVEEFLWLWEEMGSSLGFPANLSGSMPRARDSGDSSTTSP